MKVERAEFAGAHGQRLAARLDAPDHEPRAMALFAHCFTCGKDIFAASRISQALTEHGIAVLRFDFTGLGASEGEFANTNFSSNLGDLIAAANHLRTAHIAPSLLIGHSLGGAAVLAATPDIPEVRAVATIGAPSDPSHVTGLFREHLDQINAEGEAEVQLAGRPFRIKRQFLEDAAEHKLTERIRQLRKALLILHAPLDRTVDIINAEHIFAAAKHPKILSRSTTPTTYSVGGAMRSMPRISSPLGVSGTSRRIPRRLTLRGPHDRVWPPAAGQRQTWRPVAQARPKLRCLITNCSRHLVFVTRLIHHLRAEPSLPVRHALSNSLPASVSTTFGPSR